ncbi:MAG: hypothetical protein KC478_13065 [Bacteriovoracaceae bacterium]|nr:hypothetical protein [Bacteriovoracaceae bacterium]
MKKLLILAALLLSSNVFAGNYVCKLYEAGHSDTLFNYQSYSFKNVSFSEAQRRCKSLSEADDTHSYRVVRRR